MPKRPQQTLPLGNFNYASLQSLMVFWSVPAAAVRPFLKGTGLEPGIFDGKALVSMNAERYASVGSTYDAMTNEVEFNVVAFPRFKAGTEPALTVQQYLNGADQSKAYGNFRINVPCDSPVAVQAGSQKYGEIKFVASFTWAVPDVNDPGVLSWWIRCYANPTQAPKSQLPYIFDLKVNTNAAGMPAPSFSAFSPVPAYANLVVKKGDPAFKGKNVAPGKHMVTSARVIFGLFKSWIPAASAPPAGPATLPAGAVAVQVGSAKSPMTKQLQAVFGANPKPVGILLYESQPAAASGHTLLMDLVR